MAVDANWLGQVRHKNQQTVGLAGMGSTADLQAAINAKQARDAAAAAAAAAAAETAARVAATPQGDLIALPPPSKTTKYILYGTVVVAGIAIAVAVYRRFRKR